MIGLEVKHSDHNHSALRSELLKSVVDFESQVTDYSNQITNHKNESAPSPPKGEKLDKQSRVISSILNAGEKTKQGLDQLIKEYKDEVQKLLTSHGYDKEREANIRQHLKKLQQQKRQRKIRIQKDLAKLEAKKKKLQEHKNSNSQQREQRRKSIEKRIQHIKQRQKSRRQQEQIFLRFYKEYKSLKPKYKCMEEQYIKRQNIQREERERIIKQKVEEAKKPLNIREIDEFQEKYFDRKREEQRIRLKNHLQEKKIAEANSAKLNELYRGNCHSAVLKQFEQRHKKAVEPFDKVKRIKEYAQFVRDQYLPSAVSAPQQNQLEDQSQSIRGKKVIRQKFLHGEYIGKRVQYEKIPLSHSEHINKGIQYLNFLKNLPKKPKRQHILDKESINSERKSTIDRIYRVQRIRNPLYSSRVHRSIDYESLKSHQGVKGLISGFRQQSAQSQLEQKVLRHQNYSDRSTFFEAQSNYNNRLVENVQMKLAMLKKL